MLDIEQDDSKEAMKNSQSNGPSDNNAKLSILKDVNQPDSFVDPNAPVDKGKAVYLTFFLYGVGVLMPFNVIMSCLDFYAYTMPDYLCGNIWPFVINFPLWTTQVLLVVYGQKITPSQRLIPGFAAQAICMLIIPALCDIGGSAGFYSTTILLVFLGFFSGACQGTAFSLAAAFPPEYMSAVMFGNGVSGFGSNLLRAATLAIWPASEDQKNSFIGAMALYSIAFVILLGCTFAQVFLRKNPYALYYMSKTNATDGKKTNKDSNTFDPERERLNLTEQSQNSSSSKITGVGNSGSLVEPIQLAGDSVLNTERKDKQSLKEYIKQARQNFGMTDGLLWALVYVFVLTFICYPGLSIDSTLSFMDKLPNYISWHILIVQTFFNLFDTIGRYAGGVPCLILSNTSIKVLSAVRTIFLVLFMLISFDVAPAALFQGDWFIILNLIFFSISNGYVSTLCAVKAPMTVEGEAKGQVGGFIGITISTGIVLGSIFAIGMARIIKLTPEYDFNY